ncbi:hypothetical protein DL95DRAFT_134921 [Leptodontidium sp. 2 PMI_412]|nr:hypothetical protein DL95DRAFT_134921 [Leptodontidium sp. 2 PMI_412]
MLYWSIITHFPRGRVPRYLGTLAWMCWACSRESVCNFPRNGNLGMKKKKKKDSRDRFSLHKTLRLHPWTKGR